VATPPHLERGEAISDRCLPKRDWRFESGSLQRRVYETSSRAIGRKTTWRLGRSRSGMRRRYGEYWDQFQLSDVFPSG